ncbi:alcohol dehydrogenase [Auriscalpium vulgare]|uniref:Alcohol dehydrogenase n=1 Tax=Auriscalpium vulgare TaxID=40419 RepID=A0ACB8RQL2_9AGAM|nr:alcohol dehydrogenase [Auriscalpium vulgare]
MAPVTNARHIFIEIPTGLPEPGKHTAHDTSRTIDLENEPLHGGFLVKTLILSIDPYMRVKMRDASIKSYSPAYAIGEPLYGYGIGRVLRSESSALKPGDHIYGALTPHEEYFVRQDPEQFEVLKNEYNLPLSLFVGVLGMPGQTAYVGWKEFSKAKPGETAFVTTAAGAVGSFVIQLAKLDGLKVIASSGSDEKAAFAKAVGADVSFNYKKDSTKDVLDREGPIDVYWDNVGGETLDLALAAAKDYARIIECGMSSQYNASELYGIKNALFFVTKSLSLNGFIVYKIFHKYASDFYREVPKLVKDGKIKYEEHLKRGLDLVGEGLRDALDGRNQGKVVIVVADD